MASTTEEGQSSAKVYVVLERACLETVKKGKDFQLLNVDDHKNILAKNNRDLSDARPDILHQSLLMLLDSPLNKAGHLKVFIHTQKNVLIDVHPQTRIPRTFKRFCGLMVQLLQKLSIRATNGPDKLLKVIRNPVISHLPAGIRIIGLSWDGKLVNIDKFVGDIDTEQPVCFVIGAIAHGKDEVDYTDEYISVSSYPLSAAHAISRITGAFERKLGIC